MAQVHTIPPAGAAMDDRGRRVVYLEDELSVEGDDIDLGFLSDENFENLNLQGLCANNCSEQALANTYVEASNMTQGICAQAPQPGACAEDVAQVAWPPAAHVPYQFARPRSDSGASGDSSVRAGFVSYGSSDYRNGGVSTERYNYAKALLESDEELGRLSLKIRSEILHSEMMELSFEAERAAESGQTRFSGRPSTYAGQKPLKPKSISRGSLHQKNSSLTDGIMALEQRRKIPVLALRDVNDVIPNWNELHAHMRTHLARRNVDETTLFFGSQDIQNDDDIYVQNSDIHNGPTSQMTSAANNFAKKSMSFLENLRDLSVLQRATKSVDPGSSEGCSVPFRKDRDGGSQCSADSSVSGLFGRTLSSHLSPTNGDILKRPKLNFSNGFLRDAGNDGHYVDGLTKKASQKTAMQPQFSMVFDFGQTNPPSHNMDLNYVQQAASRTIETVDTTSSSGSFNEDDRKRTVACRDEGSSVRSGDNDALNPVALFNASEDDGETSCSHLANRSSLESSLDELPASTSLDNAQFLTLTPREDGGWSTHGRKQPSDFVTPARLREMRGRRRDLIEETSSTIDGNLSNAPGKISTPEATKFTFEPSSIIDSGSSMSPRKAEVGPIAVDKALFLALPSIQSVPNEKYGVRARELTISQKEDPLIRFPRQRTSGDAIGLTASGVAIPDHLNAPIPEETSEQADSEHGQLAGSMSLSSSANGESVTKSLQRMELEDPSEFLSTNPIWYSKDKSVSSKQSDDQHCSGNAMGTCEQRQDVASLLIGKNVRKLSDRIVSNDLQSAVCREGQVESEYMVEEAVSQGVGEEQRPEGKAGVLGEDSKRQPLSLNSENAANPPKSPESCLIDDASVSTGDSSEDHEVPCRIVERGRLECQDAMSILETWGGQLAPNPPEVRRVVSWANPGADVALGSANHDTAVAHLQSDLACETFAVATSEIISAGAETMCNQGRPNSPGTASFQAAMDMISGFSSTRKDVDVYFPESENDEYLNNYFYCGKQGGKTVSHKLESSVDGNVCIDPGLAREALCTMGVDNVCSSFTFLFASGQESRKRETPIDNGHSRTLSVGPERVSQVDNSDSWLGVLDMASARFSFGRRSTNEGRTKFHPPCLKKTSGMTVPQSTPPRNTRTRSEGSRC